jgi:hypothetical protein
MSKDLEQELDSIIEKYGSSSEIERLKAQIAELEEKVRQMNKDTPEPKKITLDEYAKQKLESEVKKCYCSNRIDWEFDKLVGTKPNPYEVVFRFVGTCCYKKLRKPHIYDVKIQKKDIKDTQIICIQKGQH